MKQPSGAEIVIHMEGGGGREMRARLRQAMQEFLRGAVPAGEGSPTVSVIPCGSRSEAYKSFRRACTRMPPVPFLLVDSESRVDWARDSAVAFLNREDGWDFGPGDEGRVHLMVQFMETWIVADPKALAAYYGKGFRAGALPRAQDLEIVGKSGILRALGAATGKTGKAGYRKGRDSAELLRRLDAGSLRERCPACERLLRALAASA